MMKLLPENHISRRSALKGLGTIGALSALSSAGLAAPDQAPKIKLKKGSVIVFQGDSITDTGRKEDIKTPNTPKALGNGYPAMVAGSLLGDYANLDLQIYNRGISGNKIPDLGERWQEDTIDLKPISMA